MTAAHHTASTSSPDMNSCYAVSSRLCLLPASHQQPREFRIDSLAVESGTRTTEAGNGVCRVRFPNASDVRYGARREIVVVLQWTIYGLLSAPAGLKIGSGKRWHASISVVLHDLCNHPKLARNIVRRIRGAVPRQLLESSGLYGTHLAPVFRFDHPHLVCASVHGGFGSHDAEELISGIHVREVVIVIDLPHSWIVFVLVDNNESVMFLEFACAGREEAESNLEGIVDVFEGSEPRT